MEFIGVADHDPRTRSNLWPLMGGRVSVVNAWINTYAANQLELLKDLQLIVRERFRWIEVECSRVMLAVELLKNGYVESERLARSGGGCDNYVFAVAQCGARFDLVTVQSNALFAQVGLHAWCNLVGRLREDWFSGRQHFGVRNLATEHWVAL